MLSTSSDTKPTLMHLFLFINSAQRELVSICNVCATAINFPCISTLDMDHRMGGEKLVEMGRV